MYKYRHERVHTRMDYVKHIYSLRSSSTVFDNFSFPIVVYDRDGKITAANYMFCEFTEITEDDIQLNRVSIFDYIDNENAGLEEAVRIAFSGVPNVYISDTRILRAETDTPEDLMIHDYPNAIFYPMKYDNEGVKLVGILLDDNKTDEGETID